MSKISYDALAIEGLKEVFLQISETCKDLDIDFFIVGAIARNIWYVANRETPKGTKDIDFGIYVPSEIEYNHLRKRLQDKFKYIASSENAFCLITPDGKQIDLLPFGGIEEADQVMIEGKGLRKISLEGFKEVYQLGAIETRIGEEKYKACSIPGIMILKLIAYDDRPESRIKDIHDINSICLHYPSIETELIWNDHFDLYDDEKDHNDVGVIVLGREMKKLVKENKKLEERLINIMDKAINEESPFLRLMINYPEKETIAMKRKIIKSLKEGFEEDTTT